jgi:hypothetical protein
MIRDGSIFIDAGNAADAARDAGDAADTAGMCRDGLIPSSQLPNSPGCGGSCGDVQADVTFDAYGVPGRVRPADGGMFTEVALDCLQRLLAGYCYPSYAGTTQTLVSHHCWVA